MTDSASLATLSAEVVNCTACLALGVRTILRDDHFDLPQPGFVGPAYATRRVMFIGQNPGVSPVRSRAEDTRFASLLSDLAASRNADSYDALRGFLSGYMMTWAVTQRYLPLERLGLRVDEIAYLNAARCRTRGNAAPPRAMVGRCGELHLSRWLDALEPRAVVFLGKWTCEAVGEYVRARGVPSACINRSRSLPGEERRRNLEEVAALLAQVGAVAASGSRQVGKRKPVVPNALTVARKQRDTSRMELEDFARLLLSLGFIQVERGKLITHPSPVPSIYLNRRRDGFVYFTAYARDGHLYSDKDLWAWLPPQQSKDNDPRFITVVPRKGKERLAFQRLLE